jgi:hypothetical protein
MRPGVGPLKGLFCGRLGTNWARDRVRSPPYAGVLTRSRAYERAAVTRFRERVAMSARSGHVAGRSAEPPLPVALSSPLWVSSARPAVRHVRRT